MADKSAQMVLEALGRAVADPDGVPLFGHKNTPGLFATTTVAKRAAQDCKDKDLLRVVPSASRGKVNREVCSITAKGLEHLLSQVPPGQVLQDLVRAVELREKQIGELVAQARQTQATLQALKNLTADVLQRILPASDPSAAADAVLWHLQQWACDQHAKDCPLPALFHAVGAASVGHFHDALRLLHERQEIWLHPWTGPLSELPEPPFALLVGHEVAYYASVRAGV